MQQLKQNMKSNTIQVQEYFESVIKFEQSNRKTQQNNLFV